MTETLPTFLEWVAESYEALAKASNFPDEIEGFLGSAEMARKHLAALRSPTEARGEPVGGDELRQFVLEQYASHMSHVDFRVEAYTLALSHPPAREAVDEEMVEAGARAIDALWSEQQARHYVFEDTDREYQAHCRDTARAALLAALQVKP